VRFECAATYNGRSSKRSTYLVDILIGERSYTAVKVTASQRTNILLGRDVMNQLCILFNGPRQIVEIHNTTYEKKPKPVLETRQQHAIQFEG